METTRILVISDAHGSMANIRAAASVAGDFQQVISCGDLEIPPADIRDWFGRPCTLVRGNCDSMTDLPAMEICHVNHHSILVAHGHRLDVDAGTDALVAAAKSNGCDIALYGHTHVPLLEKRDGVTVFNPGSLTYPRQRDRKRTFGVIAIDENGRVSVEQYDIENAVAAEEEAEMGKMNFFERLLKKLSRLS